MSKKTKEKEQKIPILSVKVARKELPDVGELVIGTVSKIFEHGAYVLLDEYGGLEAYAPINEIVQSWFHSIKDYLKPNQKTVFRVIRVDPKRKLIDISLRKVRDEEKREKLMKWKRTLRAVKLFELVSQKVGIPTQELVEKIGWKFEDIYGDMLKGFEEIAKTGKTDILIKLGIPEKIVNAIYEIAKEHIEIPEVTISGIIRMINIKPDGVEHIKNVLIKAQEKAKEYKDVKVKIYVLGPPRYRIDVTSKDPKKADQVLKELATFIIEGFKKKGGEVSFTKIGE